jgi:hypothetical protein
MKSIMVDVTTAADGSATAYSAATKGLLHSVSYVKDATTAFTDGVDFTITVENSGEGVWTQADQNASATKYPRPANHDLVGAGVTFDGTRPIRDMVAIANSRFKIVIAAGGNAKKGRFVFVLRDE